MNTVEVQLPPLRERKDDIPILAAFFLREQASRYGKKVTSFSQEAMQLLLAHPWPGNVREMRHAVERAVLMAQDDVVDAAALELRPKSDGSAKLDDMTLEEAERFLIRKTLARSDGNVSRAAEALGLSRSALYRRIQQYGL